MSYETAHFASTAAVTDEINGDHFGMEVKFKALSFT